MSEVTIKDFFDATYEKSINRNSLYYSYEVPYEEIIDYVKKINEIPLIEICSYIAENKIEYPITSKEIFQFSSFDDATFNICNILKAINNPGVTNLHAGKVLQNDGVERSDGTFRKYGENHLKTGAALGLLYEMTDVYFISCLGFVYDELSIETRNNLMARLILRSKLVSSLFYRATEGTVYVREYLMDISDNTYIRRKPNVQYILNKMNEQKELDLTPFIDNLIF